jgi:predicted nucleotidyltransferase
MNSSLSIALKNLVKDLNELMVKYAFVGALAIGARGRTRQTVDIDIAVSILPGDQVSSSEELINKLVLREYGINNIYKDGNSLVMARLFSSKEDFQLVEVDILFELCGIEDEVVESAEMIEIWPSIFAPIATMPALLAMKARCQELPERIQDKADLVNQLIPFAKEADINEARRLIKLIEDRGFNEGRNLLLQFDELVNSIKGKV